MLQSEFGRRNIAESALYVHLKRNRGDFLNLQQKLLIYKMAENFDQRENIVTLHVFLWSQTQDLFAFLKIADETYLNYVRLQYQL